MVVNFIKIFIVYRIMANYLMRRALMDAIRVPLCTRASSSSTELAKVTISSSTNQVVFLITCLNTWMTKLYSVFFLLIFYKLILAKSTYCHRSPPLLNFMKVVGGLTHWHRPKSVLIW